MVVFRPQRGVLLFIFLFAVVIISSKLVKGREVSAGTRFDLIHRHDLRRIGGNGARPISQLERLKQLLHSDSLRFLAISRKARVRHGGGILGTRRQVLGEDPAYHPACSNGSSKSAGAGEMRIHSGADYGSGQYFVRFKVGSPSQKVLRIADTGSDLTWMHCVYECSGGNCGRNSNRRRVFEANSSSSFKTVPCSSSMCKTELANLFSLARCPSPVDPCAFDYRASQM